MRTNNAPNNPPRQALARAPMDQAPTSPLQPEPFGMRDIRRALRIGWVVFRAVPGPSLALGAVFALIGVALLLSLTLLGVSALGLVLAGGFILIGPVLLAGFFALFRQREAGRQPGIRDALVGFAEAGTGFWALSGLCAFLLLVWVTDAGVLYVVLVGSGPSSEAPTGSGIWLWLTDEVQRFALWSSLMGAAIALGLYVVSAFSVPLVYERRAGVISAIQSSVRAVLGNLIPALTWGLVIAAGTLVGILFPPLLPVTLPVLAYGSFDLYRTVFPLED